MSSATEWIINIDNFLGGFAPAWYKETYPAYGNKNQAGAMTNIDLTNPGFMTQGPGLADLTNGTQAGVVTTLIKGATDLAVSSGVAFAIGGAKLYKFSSTTVTSDGTWPHTIDKAAVTGEDGEDVAYYKGALYFSYNHSGSAGDIGKYDLSATFDDDWGSTIPTGAAALQSAPHPFEVGGNDVLYFGNGVYVGHYDGTTFEDQGLDLPTNSVVQDIKWINDRLWILANRPDTSGTNKNSSSLYVWDGTTTSWELEIKLMGTGGALHHKNGVLLVFYQDLSSTGGYKLGYVSGNGVVDIVNFTGGLPEYYQITDYLDLLLWNANGLLWAFGSGDKDLPARLFQLADGGYTNVGCVVTPFGTPVVASWDAGTNYRLAQFSGYDVNSAWKSLMFDITGPGRTSKINTVRINFETLAANARVDWKLLNNQGVTIYSDIISHTKLGAVTTAWYNLAGKPSENFRIEFDSANGNATNPVKIKNVRLYGTSE